MLARVKVYFNPEIFAKIEGGFPKREKYICTRVWWISSTYWEIVEESEADEVRERAIEKMQKKIAEYKVGDICPFDESLFTYRFTEKPCVIPNFDRMEIELLKDMSTEEVLKIATIPQILQEFGELKIK